MSFDDIIRHVEARPELWAKSNPYLKRRDVHKKIWRQIGKAVKCEETVLKKRWKHLKDQYRKELKKLKANPNDLPDHCRPTWQYFEQLSFLKEELTLKDRLKPVVYNNTAAPALPPAPVSDAESQEISDYDSDFDTISKSIPQTKTNDSQDIKLNLILKRIRAMNNALQTKVKQIDELPVKDPDYMYLVSLLPSLKNLTEIQKLQFRGKINDWLLEAYTQNEYTKQCDTLNINDDNKEFLQARIEMEREG